MDQAIPYIDEDIITVKTSFHKYTGGAHGLTTFMYSHYCYNSKKKFDIDDIINENSKGNLVDIIKVHLSKQWDLDSVEEIYDIILTEVFIPDSFYFNNKEIIFVYNQYELAPYAVGWIEVAVPFAEIKDYFKKSSPLSKFF